MRLHPLERQGGGGETCPLGGIDDRCGREGVHDSDSESFPDWVSSASKRIDDDCVAGTRHRKCWVARPAVWKGQAGKAEGGGISR